MANVLKEFENEDIFLRWCFQYKILVGFVLVHEFETFVKC